MFCCVADVLYVCRFCVGGRVSCYVVVLCVVYILYCVVGLLCLICCCASCVSNFTAVLLLLLYCSVVSCKLLSVSCCVLTAVGVL